MFKYEKYKSLEERKKIYNSKVINNNNFIQNDFLMNFYS